MHRTSSSTSEDSLKLSSGGLGQEQGESARGLGGDPELCSLSKSAPAGQEAKSKSRSLNPFAVRSGVGPSGGGPSSENQIPSRLLQLARSKDKKDKKKKKGKEQVSQTAGRMHVLSAISDK